jgi:hypothetical protein
LYSSSSIIRIIKSRKMRWARHVARNGKERDVCRILVGKPSGKKLLGRPRRRWVGSVETDLGEIGRGDMDWIDPVHDSGQWIAVVNTVMSLQVS